MLEGDCVLLEECQEMTEKINSTGLNTSETRDFLRSRICK